MAPVAGPLRAVDLVVSALPVPVQAHLEVLTLAHRAPREPALQVVVRPVNPAIVHRPIITYRVHLAKVHRVTTTIVHLRPALLVARVLIAVVLVGMAMTIVKSGVAFSSGPIVLLRTLIKLIDIWNDPTGF